MSKYHSTVSRRDFMKGLGLAGAGLGAAVAATPVFHDLDELASSPGGNSQYPWWIQEVDEPTTEIDWSVVDHAAPYSRYRSPIGQQLSDARTERRRQGALNNIPGDELKDYSLAGAVGSAGPSFGPWTGPKNSYTPEGIDVSPHQGSPEENLRMVRAAMSYFGCARIGVAEIDSSTNRKLFSSRVRFENVEKAYEDGNVKVVPHKCKYVLCWAVKQQVPIAKCAIGLRESGPCKGYAPFHGKASTYTGYSDCSVLRFKLAKFLNGLGYQALRPGGLPVAWGPLAGVSELSRVNFSTSPEYGAALRMTDFMVTDLPLTITKPIDGGVVSFCKSCMKCAESCPTKSLSFEREPTWELHEYEGTAVNRPGICSWRIYWPTCVDYGSPRDCHICQFSCPFNAPRESIIHEVVRATSSIAPIFHGFFATMDSVFGYGAPLDSEDWWNRDLNSWRYDTRYGFGSRRQ